MKSLIGALVLIAGSYVVMAKAPMLLWESLYRSKKAVPTFDSEIRIAGYMIPIEANPKFATEFILVPSIPACLHACSAPTR